MGQKKAVAEEQGCELANEFGIHFLETGANGMEAFFTFTRYVVFLALGFTFCGSRPT